MPSRPLGSIEATSLWKRFRSDRGRMMLRDTVERVQRRMRGGSEGDWRWVLLDVGFSVEPGEALALLGTNGSGKSTLLKLINGVMYPYAGSVDVRGRVGALIDVRGGIHPDLTGRENVYLYGSLVGLTRKQVAERFDEIVAFAELEHAVDRQVKFYSTGMQMRLGFAVASHVDPDILLVDEVLAVGDATFQQKCLDRIGLMLRRGTTLVFVSHDLAAVEATCDRGVWLDEGVVAADGPVRESLAAYRTHVESEVQVIAAEGPIQLRKATLTGAGGRLATTESPLDVTLVFESDAATTCRVSLGLTEGGATPIFVVSDEVRLASGSTTVRCRLPHLPVPRGRFFCWLALLESNREVITWQPVASVDVGGPDLDPVPRAVVRLAPVHVPSTWDVEPG
jgi:ABC-type polysaccharide/polyol phosphate transport system ATPase subunit